MIPEYIEKHFSSFLQSKISFEINNKIIKKGRLILLAVKDFHVFFVLQPDVGGSKQFILPLPYGVEIEDNNRILMDYTLETLSMHDKNLLMKFRTTGRKKNTRFFDTKVYCKK